jgi:hypothetical protein
MDGDGHSGEGSGVHKGTGARGAPAGGGRAGDGKGRDTMKNGERAE